MPPSSSPPSSLHLSFLTSVLIWTTGPLAAATAPDPAMAALEQLRVANQARTEHAREAAAWTLEHQRLQALLDATLAENARLERDAAAAEATRDTTQTRLAALGQDGDLAIMQTRLAQAGERLDAALAALAAHVPPGTIPVVTDTGFDAAVRRLEAAERSANAVAVEVVTGLRDGRPTAVKVLRVAGAMAWWVSLDGTAAGTVRMENGTVRLDTALNETPRIAIMHALAQAEGRAQPAISLLPTTGAQP